MSHADSVPHQSTVLLVDDDRSALLVMETLLEKLGYNVETASNGAEAFALLREDAERAQVVLTDRLMPVMDGLALTRRLKREPATKKIPVVILTGEKQETDVSAGIQAGAFYYLTKPPAEQLVEAVLKSAFQEVQLKSKLSNELAGHKLAFGNLETMRFRLTKPDEVEGVASLLASMSRNPDRAIQGIYELVQNAVEHGVLGFGFEAKSKLLESGDWNSALSQRSRDPQYAGGWAEVTAVRKEQGIYISVKDSGKGFNWRAFLTSDPSRAAAACGRGIARAASLSFDKLTFNEAGNAAVGLLLESPKVKW
jgi:two-component system cell cycle response regulator